MPNVTAIGTAYPAPDPAGNLIELSTTYQSIDAASARLNMIRGQLTCQPQYDASTNLGRLQDRRVQSSGVSHIWA